MIPKKPIEQSNKHKLSAFAKLLIGGGSAVGLAFRYNRFALCNSGRLAGYQANVIKNDTIAFDWRKFWTYLKPHLLKFLGAIAVCQYTGQFAIGFTQLVIDLSFICRQR